MDIEKLYALYLQHPEIVTDTRKIVEGGIFFALKGEKFDGNSFAKMALEKGCSYAIVDDEKIADGKQILLTDNVLLTLQQLATYHREQWRKPVLAITGTNGKTTTKELVAQVLQTNFSVLYTQGNFNNQIGVPLTLLKLKEAHDFAVIEMGANHPNDIKELVEIAHPNYGIITNVGRAHLQGFGSFKGVKEAKGALYDYLKEHDGLAYVNAADTDLMQMIQERKKKLDCAFYGPHPQSMAWGELRHTNEKLSFDIHTFLGSKKVNTKLIGEYNMPNVLAAIAIGLDFGVDLENAVEAVEKYTPSNMRSEYKKTEYNRLVIDTYNANPTSMEASLHSFAHLDGKNKIVIAGDMKELGEESVKEHQHIVNLLQKMKLSDVLFCGEEYGKCQRTFGKHFPTTEALCQYLQTEPLKNALILIKGSHSMQLEKCLEFL